MTTLLRINSTLFQKINAFAGVNPWLDMLMVFCANSLIFFFPLILLMWWGRPLSWSKQPLRSEEGVLLKQRRSVVVWVGLACLVAYGLNLLIEQFIFEPRPFVTLHIHPLIVHAADASFPSDHSAWAFAVVGMLLFQFLPAFSYTYRLPAGEPQRWKLLRVPCFLLILTIIAACSIGIARIFVGVHYPGDILGGATDGIVAASLMTFLRQRFRQPVDAILQLAQTLHLA